MKGMVIKLEVEFKKDLRHNYMIISHMDEQKLQPYCIKLLEHQSMEGLLPLELSRIDNKILFYYDITAKQSMNTILDKTVLSSDKLKQLCTKIIQIIEKAYEYLLPDDDFVLSPEYIYLNVVSNAPSLCFLPGYQKGIKEQMSGLMEYLMNKVDYNDKEAVVLVYQLYALSKEAGYTFEHLMTALQDKSEITTKMKVNQKVYSKDEIDQPRNCTPDIEKNDANLASNSNKQALPFYKSRKEENHTAANNNFGINGARATTENQKNSLSDIPVMLERIEQEEELACYPLKTYLCTGACAAVGIIVAAVSFFTKILYNTYGNRIDISKLFALVLIVACLEGYLLNKIWDKKNKITKIVQKKEYIDPRQDFSHRGAPTLERNNNEVHSLMQVSSIVEAEKAHTLTTEIHMKSNISKSTELIKGMNDSLIDEDENPTRLLNEAANPVMGYLLKPFDDINYKSISIRDFPFFIGKLKKNVDYCLEKDVVSRYHAKITKEEDRYYITDLNSTNGTYINGEAVQTYQKKEIKIGDEIAFADIKYRFCN